MFLGTVADPSKCLSGWCLAPQKYASYSTPNIEDKLFTTNQLLLGPTSWGATGCASGCASATASTSFPGASRNVQWDLAIMGGLLGNFDAWLGFRSLSISENDGYRPMNGIQAKKTITYQHFSWYCMVLGLYWQVVPCWAPCTIK